MTNTVSRPKSSPESSPESGSGFPSVPVHALGISQIIAYGFLFYAFAQLKTPLADRLGIHTGDVLIGVTISLMINGLLAPLAGYWFDRFGALRVLATGLIIGSASLILLTWCMSFATFIAAMVILGVGFSMCNYEAAFSAAVQINENGSRRNISIITFYGGVASSLTWLMIAPLMHHVGFVMTMYVLAAILLVMAIWAANIGRHWQRHQANKADHQVEPFRWSELTRTEKIALITLALSSAFEYLSFGAVALTLIQWYQELFGMAGIAVLLASIYGPFQVVGRVLEMRYGAKHDARYTAICAFVMVPTAIMLIQYPSMITVVIGMALFGMGHGILTVSFGYITNMYFRAAVYGRAKGWISTPRALGMATGPLVAGILYDYSGEVFLTTMVFVTMLAGFIFATILTLRPRDGF
ncbi:MAG: MFS transporter [Alphaproteobacteria bacterium]|nr:MFS transporter [Alphaproteobacteria bacterium]